MPKTSSSQPSDPVAEASGALPADYDPRDREAMAQALVLNESQTIMLEERIAELEFELEDVGWLREGQQAAFEFSPQNLLRIINWSRIMYLKNPLIGHGVEVKADYIFAQGINVAVADTEQKALEDFMLHPKNAVELTTTDALWAKEVRLQTEGNIFFALFVQAKGKPIVIRTIPVHEVLTDGDIICNPEDRREPWYYKRVWYEDKVDLATGEKSRTRRCDYYPDWRYVPKTKRTTIGKGKTRGKVHWKTPVMHLAVGKTDEMKFGIPETYRALSWARATVRDLEDYASIKRALARFAWKAEMRGGKPAIAALKNKLATSVSTTSPIEDNPPPATGSTWAATTGYDMMPMKTAGAQADSDSGRQIRVMTGTGLGLPDTILSGDASAGALATAKTLDRPTELKMLKRQGMWSLVLQNLIAYSVARQAGKAPESYETGRKFAEAAESAESFKAINIDFPPILERDAAGRVAAVISAATLDGKSKAGTMTDKNLVVLLLQALGLDDDLDEYLKKLKFDKDDMFEETEEEKLLKKARVAGLAGSPGGPVPGPDPGAPPDRQAQGLAKQEPGATPSEIMAQRNRESDITQQLRLLRETLEEGASLEDALGAVVDDD